MADTNIYEPTDAAVAPTGYQKAKSSAKTLADTSRVQRIVPAVSTGSDSVADVSATAPMPVVLRKSDGSLFNPSTSEGLDALATILGAVAASPTANTVQARLKAIADLLTTQSAYLDGVETNQSSGNTLLTAIDTKLGTQAGYLDGVETTLTSILAKLIAAPATEAKQDSQVSEIVRIGTRSYGVGTKLAVTSASAVSGAIAATEVMIHATARCFIKAGSAPTAVDSGDSIPLEAGEKFVMRITSGHKIAAVRSSSDADGSIYIIPVV